MYLSLLDKNMTMILEYFGIRTGGNNKTLLSEANKIKKTKKKDC